MVELELAGCRPEPLAHYLKALAVLRLVAEQKDPEARGFWRGDVFVLRSSLDRDALVRFFVEEYRPTPIIAPWNGGSGFWPKDNRVASDFILRSNTARFAAYRAAIEGATSVMDKMGLTGDSGEDDNAKAWKETKARLIGALRSELPDEALAWLDAALVLTPEGPNFPPLLGTGGNDGRLDFSNNQMQRLVDLFIAPDSPAAAHIASALFRTPTPGLQGHTMGQFLPSGMGGTNGGPGFSGKGVSNLWDYVLMIEGALVPAAATTRRLESNRMGALSYPFTVRSSGVGYGSAAAKDEDGSRDEIWLPLWNSPATSAGVRALFNEGRVKVATAAKGRTTAVTGAEFSRALATLGVDRGVGRFIRYGFLQRNGLAYLATPLGQQKVERQGLADVLAPLDYWLDALRRAGSDSHAPSSWRRARGEVERAVLDVCTGRAHNLLDLLLGLAAAERAFAGQVSKAAEKGVRPVPLLPAASWMPHLIEDSAEFRLARALASAGYRRRIVPITVGNRPDWDSQSKVVTFGEAALESNLIATLQRMSVERGQGKNPPQQPGVFARLDDIEAWLDGRTDDTRLAAMVHALSLVGPHIEAPSLRATGRSPDGAFAACALAWDGHPTSAVALPEVPGLLGRLVGDRVSEATALALTRLRASGLPPRVDRIAAGRGQGPRLAAALAFPLSPADKAELLASFGYRTSQSQIELE